MNESKLLTECEWKAKIIISDKTYGWFLWTLDDSGSMISVHCYDKTKTSKDNDEIYCFDTPEAARADCLAFMKRNGWKKYKFI